MPAVSQLAFKIFCANLKYFLPQGTLVAGAKPQAPSFKPQANRPQAPSRKHQAPSNKPQA